MFINVILLINGKKVGFMKYKNVLRKFDKRSSPHPPLPFWAVLG